jgi:maltose O-acetyltransferase
MLAGELYDPLDPQLLAERRRARLLLKAFNETRDDEPDERARLLGELFGAGSVVTRDIPARVLAAGNPCRVIREIKD